MEINSNYFIELESKELYSTNGGTLTEAMIWGYAMAGSYDTLYFLCVVMLGINPVGLTVGIMASLLVAALH
ncbi:hypothetical protein [Senegalia sp. (in: firmicutes)]|uniref:hypothetical protein n=1 Tax=Senegalia sp. (in: firmicutes) TaxID=1924098 RepID=UPI003F99D625